MRYMRVAFVIFIFHFYLLPAHCSDGNDVWRSIGKLPLQSTLVFVERNQTCHKGRIKAVTSQSVLIQTEKSQVTIEKENLLRIHNGSNPTNSAGNSYLPLLTVYSGRSSWSDLMEFMPALSAFSSLQIHLFVTTIGDKLHKGMLKNVTNTDLTVIDDFGKQTSILKTDVSRVDYVRAKLLSDKEEFYWEELAMLRVFDPALYPRLFHIQDTMSVRLYDRAIAEDNSPVRCR